MFTDMKKNLFALIIFIMMTINGFAQYKPFQFGLSFSPSICTTKSNCDIIDNGLTKLSYNWGFKGNFYFVENYGFSTGFNVLNIRGGHSYEDKTHGKINAVIKNQYLEFPLSMIMRTERLGKTRIVGNIGYGMGFLLKASQENTDSNNKAVEIDNQFSMVRHSLIIKIGAEVNVYKSSCLSAFFVFNNNFSNIYTYDNPFEHNISMNNLSLEIDFVF